MDFLRRLEPGRASTAAAARPAVPPAMAPMPLASLASLASPASPSSRLASVYAQPSVAASGATGAWPDGMATAPHDDRTPPRQAAPRAPFDGALRGPFQAAPATPGPPTSRALEPLRPRAEAARSSALQNAGGRLRGAPAEPSGVPNRPLEFRPPYAPRRDGTVAPSRQGRAPPAALGQPLSAAALQARASALPAAIAAPAPALHITIDRIEVRAAAAAPNRAPAQRQPKTSAVSLADYLRSGAGAKAAS